MQRRLVSVRREFCPDLSWRRHALPVKVWPSPDLRARLSNSSVSSEPKAVIIGLGSGAPDLTVSGNLHAAPADAEESAAEMGAPEPEAEQALEEPVEGQKDDWAIEEEVTVPEEEASFSGEESSNFYDEREVQAEESNADILDQVSHGSGRVTLEQYRDYFNVTNAQNPQYAAAVEAMFHAHDKDNNGVLTIDEIEEMLPSDDTIPSA